MIDREIIKKMSEPISDDKAYYRPFICDGDIRNSDIFFVAINPATPIYPEEMDLETYTNLILNYKSFMDYYKKKRIREGKSEYSRTRIGMNSFFFVVETVYKK